VTNKPRIEQPLVTKYNQGCYDPVSAEDILRSVDGSVATRLAGVMFNNNLISAEDFRDVLRAYDFSVKVEEPEPAAATEQPLDDWDL